MPYQKIICLDWLHTLRRAFSFHHQGTGYMLHPTWLRTRWETTDHCLQKSSVTLFTSDIHQSWLQPQVQVRDEDAPLHWTPKILGVALNTCSAFGPHGRWLYRASPEGTQRHESLSWDFTNDTLKATYKAIVMPIRFTQVCSTNFDKLEVIQNKAPRIATGYHQKALVSHLRAETGILPLRAHLELYAQESYASALQPMHPSHLIVTTLPSPSRLPSRPP